MASFIANIGVAIICAILILSVRLVRKNEDSAESCALLCETEKVAAAVV